MTVKHRVAQVIGSGPAGRIAVRAMAPFVRAPRLAVFTYHRIAATSSAARSLTPGLASAGLRDFEEQLRYVQDRFCVISMDDLLAIRHGERHSERRPMVMITFDDAYRDVLDLAWPVIQSVGLPVSVFVSTAFPDQGQAYWWDQLAFSLRQTARPWLEWRATRLRLSSGAERLAAMRRIHDDLQQLPTHETIAELDALVEGLDTGPAPAEVLTWDEIRQLAACGVTIGGHSHAHHRVDLMDRVALHRDLERCRAIISEQLGSPPRAFAYPTGYHSDAAVEAVEAAGFEVAFTTDRGVGDPRRLDWYRVPRINVGLRSNPSLLGLQALVLRQAGRARRVSVPPEPDV